MGTCAGTLGTLLWNLYLEVLWEPVRCNLGTLSELYLGNPYLGNYREPVTMGILKTSTCKSCQNQHQYHVILGTLGTLWELHLVTFTWEYLPRNLDLGTCPHRNLYFTWQPLLGNLRLETLTWQLYLVTFA